ncbi:helix-turn-helix domain-containing protein [Dactylosporangium sp. NPDC050588]|uniref:ArsR/SmtB family transcription factor n=1 Tax=unclassified Dactylosporangium TaxID=2621675 RepID=UPI0033C07DFB
MRRPATDAEAKALASGVRLRIIRLCLDRALTNKEIAERLDANPATVLHHVRTLVATGFLVPQEERRGPRGSREVPYLSTRKSWQLSGSGSNEAMLEAFHQELALLQDQAGSANFARLGLRLTPQQWQELQDRFEALLDEYAHNDQTHGQAYSIFLAMYEDRSRD